MEDSVVHRIMPVLTDSDPTRQAMRGVNQQMLLQVATETASAAVERALVELRETMVRQ